MIVKIYKDFLSALPEGAYSLHISLDDGAVQIQNGAQFGLSKADDETNGGGETDPSDTTGGNGSTGGGGSPVTGDDTNTGLWITLFALSVAGIAAVLVWQKKRKSV
ncbi:MAG: LPXTG cell wall anchor domain-containing protein [Christensenellales bacterium]